MIYNPEIIITKLKSIINYTRLKREETSPKCVEFMDEAGYDHVKTATGVGPGGANSEDVRLMRATVGDRLGVKASGGIRTWKDAREMLSSGADRIGTSAGPRIMEDFLDESA
ncbi:MAG: hypothetical protein JW738_08700 [Actinobacteria bacterium]|nr:hypothetical protein [Actinomycetota bacterium]